VEISLRRTASEGVILLRWTGYILHLTALLVLASAVSPVFAEKSPEIVRTFPLGVDPDPLRIDVSLTNAHRWYSSVLTQHQIISDRIDEMREKLHQDLLGTQDFLDEVSTLFERTDRLYATWKELENATADPPKDEDTVERQRPSEPPQREDAAVGKSLNYLRLSLINFFLGYCDSNGKQIDDAEKQARLSKLWRTRSKLFVKALDS
jgi:hypothetical protein